jgi:hypothetical protein
MGNSLYNRCCLPDIESRRSTEVARECALDGWNRAAARAAEKRDGVEFDFSICFCERAVLYALFVFMMFVPLKCRLLADYTGIKKSALSRIRRSEWSIFIGHSRLVDGVGHCLSRSMF